MRPEGVSAVTHEALVELEVRATGPVCAVLLSGQSDGVDSDAFIPAAVAAAGLHVDPLALSAKCVIDATGHDAEIARGVLRKIPGARFSTENGTVPGERPMHAEIGEAALVENTQEVYPGLIVAGMAANAVFASPRMGPIFGGMFLSGQRAAEVATQIIARRAE